MLLCDIIRNFDRFQYFNFASNFLDNENFFQQTRVLFLVESIKIEGASFPYKTAMWETNVKTNIIGSTKWTYHKERSFVSNNFYLIKNLSWVLT